MKHHFVLLFLCMLFCCFAFGQKGFTVNQKVEVEWKGKWYKATVLAVNGNNYKIRYDGYSSSYDETVGPNRIRTMGGKGTAAAAAQMSPVKYGKYGCTASKYRNGSYEYLSKGAFTINKNGTYAYYGFEKPSTGTFMVDAATGVISFKGGYFNGGEATPIEGSENRYYLVFPTITDNRWTCGFMGDQ